MPAKERSLNDEEREPLTKEQVQDDNDEGASVSSVSTTSLVLEHIGNRAASGFRASRSKETYRDNDAGEPYRGEGDGDIENGRFLRIRPVDKKARLGLWIVGTIGLIGWILALGSFVIGGSYKPASSRPHDPLATSSRGSGRKVTLDQVLTGQWYPRRQSVSWIAGPHGEDGLLLEKSQAESAYLVVEDIRSKVDESASASKNKYVLMKTGSFSVGGDFIFPSKTWPSRDFKKVLVLSDEEKNWRHSYTGR
jgi:dipeptidyl aminopeptidase B